jgi:hypothetical protein
MMYDSVKNSSYLPLLLDSQKVQSNEIYGKGAHLVASHAVGEGIGLPRPNVAFFGANFSLSLLLLMLLSVFFLVFRKNLSTFLSSVLHFRKFWSYRRTQSWNNPLFFVFLFLFSVFSLALFLTEVFHYFAPEWFENKSFLFLFVGAGGVTACFLLLRFFVCWLIGFISNEKQLFSDIVYSQMLFFAAMSFTIVPIILVKNFCVDVFAMNVFMLLCFLLLLIFILYFFRTIRLFIQEKDSIFFWILYFCTIEILPIIVAVKNLEGIQ